MGFLAVVKSVGAGGLVYIEPVSATDPGYGGGNVPVDPGYGQGGFFPHPGHGLPGGGGHPDHDLPWGPGHPGNRPPGSWGGRPDQSLPIAPVRPSPPIVLPPVSTWPPQVPNLPDNTLPPGHGHPSQPIVIPPDPSIGIEAPIYLPQLPAGTALLIALTGANVPLPKDVPPGNKPAILYQGAGTKPVLVYVAAAPSPKQGQA